MKFVPDKAKLVSVECDEGIGHAPIVDGNQAFFLGNGHINILDLDKAKFSSIYYQGLQKIDPI